MIQVHRWFLTLGAFLAGAGLTWLLLRTSKPEDSGRLRQPAAEYPSHGDAELVRSLLGENLSDRMFDFTVIAGACSGKKVIPLNDSEAHRRVTAAIHTALASCIAEMNQPDSPIRSSRRINEGSKFFEDGLMARLNATPGLSCSWPTTRSGEIQRSGYPDLRIVDETSGGVFYLDPKLVEKGSEKSTLRTFYFEPKDETLKITDDAVHLLVGIEHDGKAREWTFSGWRLVDLSTLRVRLKAEFQTSNAGLYEGSVLSTSQPADR